MILSLCMVAAATGVGAQQPAASQPAPASADPGAIVPLQIDVVVARYVGEKADKKVSSVPYSLSVNAIEGPPGARPLTRLRMGGRVPIPTMAPPTDPSGKPITGGVNAGPVTYQDVGTNIDCRAGVLRGGLFDVSLTLEESSVAANPPVPGVPNSTLPVLRQMQATNNLVLKDGQTRQFTAATDRITGEVVKVEVTLKVVK
jgi:hypothetical protein